MHSSRHPFRYFLDGIPTRESSKKCPKSQMENAAVKYDPSEDVSMNTGGGRLFPDATLPDDLHWAKSYPIISGRTDYARTIVLHRVDRRTG
jgi:hypothetical protein